MSSPSAFQSKREHGAQLSADAGVAPLLVRSVTLLRCFTAERFTLSARELVELSGIPRSTVHRLVADLTTLGLLTRTDSGRYCVGSLVWELAQFSELQVTLRHAAQVHLTRLYDACGENVFLGVMTTHAPETAEAMYVGHVRGPNSAETSAEEGRVLPLLGTALGMALLSARTPAWQERYVRRVAPRSDGLRGPRGGTREILTRLAGAGRTGYVVQASQAGRGSIAVAAPIPWEGGEHQAAAVEIVMHPEAWDEPRIPKLLTEAATGIAADLRTRETPTRIRGTTEAGQHPASEIG